MDNGQFHSRMQPLLYNTSIFHETEREPKLCSKLPCCALSSACVACAISPLTSTRVNGQSMAAAASSRDKTFEVALESRRETQGIQQKKEQKGRGKF